MNEALQPWGDDVPLRGDGAPRNDGSIKHLIEYLLTVHKRFGNTAVTASLQWGATALWKRDEQAKRIVELEEQLAKAQSGPTVSLGGCAPTLYGSGGTLGTLGPFSLKCHVDPDMAEDEMEFRDGITGRVLAKIINIGKA